jgi:hypothetical protein
MKLFEFADDDPLRVKLVAVANQLKNRVGEDGATMSTDELLNFFKQNDIILDKADLFDIVKKEPLKNIIQNVNKDQVQFVGQKDGNLEPKPSENERVLSQMASKQVNKL